MKHLDYRALAVLEAVASHGSFDKAALALGITQPAVSQRIKALEDASGRLLIVRGQPALPTGLGQRLITHYRHVKLMEASLDIDLGRQLSMPEIAVAVDAGSLSTWFPDSLAALMAPPRCQLDVRLADSATALQLVRDGSVFACVAAAPEAEADSAAAAEAGPAGGAVATALGMLQYVCVATPAFAGHWFGDGFSAEAAQLAPAVVSDAGLMARFLGEQLAMHEAFPHHTLPAAAALEACIAGGLAYGLMPLRRAAAGLASEQLVELLPGRSLNVPLSWFTWNLDTPFTKLLSEQVVGSARAYLPQR
ncbi:MAG TPA: ArgP/LysG family DNA-binding transcriptional regulator [Janthinobacterium sp.]|jgi:LysR family transcriptional regulator (chromosome initiation inhibitor)|nr:ArgP/LysG family DNA-binding transcriptional regulator [Janthinobacterium sp.]